MDGKSCTLPDRLAAKPLVTCWESGRVRQWMLTVFVRPQEEGNPAMPAFALSRAGQQACSLCKDRTSSSPSMLRRKGSPL